MSASDPRKNSKRPDVHLEVGRRFAKHKQRYSNKRRAIVSLLETADKPLTITEILRRSKNTKGRRDEIAQSSLYRNLLVLEDVGAIQRVASTDDLSRYELTEDILGHHHHMLCSSCGEMRDVKIPHRLEAELNATFKQLAKKSGFKLAQHRLDLIGRCKNC